MGRRVRGFHGRLCGIQSGNTKCYGEEAAFGREYSPYTRTEAGDLWAGARRACGGGSLVLRNSIRCGTRAQSALIEGDNGALLIATRGGIIQLADGKEEAYPLPVGRQFRATRLFRDRNGGLWIGTVDKGLLHVHPGRTDRLCAADGLSGDPVSCLFEDREGNIWVATLDGLDRFRDFAVPTISVQQGLSSQSLRPFWRRGMAAFGSARLMA